MRKILLYLVLLLCGHLAAYNSALVDNAAFEKTVFAQQFFANQALSIPACLYLGGSNAPLPEPLTDTEKQLRAYDLSRAYIAADGTAKIAPLALTKDVIVNADEATKGISPINNTKITNLSLYQELPVVTVVPATVTDDDKNKVYVLLAADGSKILKNKDVIKDANGDPASALIALESSDAHQFVAVSAKDYTWSDSGGINRGIAVLAPDDKLTLINVYDTTDFSKTGDANKARLLSLLPADRCVTFTQGAAQTAQLITGAELGDNVAMHWDSTLQRLYICLSNVGRKQDELIKEGGFLGISLARVNTNSATKITDFVIKPIINAVHKELFYADEKDKTEANVNDRIIGFYYDGANPKGTVLPNGGIVANNGYADVNVSIRHVRVMHTSTGKHYLIVNSNIGDGTQASTVQGVFALPLLGAKKSDGVTAIADSLIGTLSKVENGIATFDEPPLTYNEMPSANDSATRVGSMEILTFPADKITQIFIEGDTVYATLNSAISAEKGVFASTALFDTDGAIRAWTPWQRVMGSIDRVWGAGIDKAFANFYALSNDPANVKKVNTVNITRWGKTDTVHAGNLSSLLAQIFPEKENGVVGMLSFDQFTPGFAVPACFAMTVVLGTNKVALVQTGHAGNDGIELTADFSISGTNQNVFVFSGGALDEIAPLTCAEVARMTTDDAGWLFVGGYRGLAVLSLADGKGWFSGTSQVPAQDGLDQLRMDGFPGDAHWTFKRLVSSVGDDAFKYVRKLIASNGKLNVLTMNSLHQFTMEADKFSVEPQSLGDVVDSSLHNKVLVDLVILSSANSAGNECFIVGTNDGIYAGRFGSTNKVTDINCFVAQLQLLGSTRSITPVSGNIYTLVADFENKNDKVYRLNVENINGNLTINPIRYFNSAGQFVTTGKLLDFYSAKQGIDTDGTFVYSTLPHNYKQFDYLDLYTISPLGVREVANITCLLDVDPNCYGMVTGVLRDGVSGAIQVPGEWGVRVNQ